MLRVSLCSLAIVVGGSGGSDSQGTIAKDSYEQTARARFAVPGAKLNKTDANAVIVGGLAMSAGAGRYPSAPSNIRAGELTLDAGCPKV